MVRSEFNHLGFTEEGLCVKSQKTFPIAVVNYLTIIRCQDVVEMTQKTFKVDGTIFIQSASSLN